jgi:ATP-dependent DNA ligase
MIAKAARRSPAVFVTFDILEAGGEDVRDSPLSERRRLLREHVEPTPGLQIIEHVETHGDALFRAIVEHDQEGIVAKRVDAPYRSNRQSTWIKIKNRDYSRRGAVEWRGR